jgi:hypothetical protein
MLIAKDKKTKTKNGKVASFLKHYKTDMIKRPAPRLPVWQRTFSARSYST